MVRTWSNEAIDEWYGVYLHSSITPSSRHSIHSWSQNSISRQQPKMQTRHYALEPRSKKLHTLSLATKCALQESLETKTCARIEKAQGQGRKNGLISCSISIANKTTTNVETQVRFVIYATLRCRSGLWGPTHARTSGSPFLLSTPWTISSNEFFL